MHLFHSLHFTELAKEPVLLKAFMVSLNAPQDILTQSLVDIFVALHEMREDGKPNSMMHAAFLAMAGTRQVPGMLPVIRERALSQVLALMFKQVWFQGDVPAQIWTMWAEKSVAPVSNYVAALFTIITHGLLLAHDTCYVAVPLHDATCCPA